jgi:hypothetical protein
MKKSKVVIPKHLKSETRRWVKSVLDSFEFESWHVKLFILSGECWDRITDARETIQRDGMFVKDRYGCLKSHPAIKIEADNKIIFARLIRELGLDLEKGDSSLRPPRMY